MMSTDLLRETTTDERINFQMVEIIVIYFLRNPLVVKPHNASDNASDTTQNILH